MAAAVAVVMRAAAAAVGLVLGAEKIVQDVDNRGDVPLGLPVAVLQRGVQCAGEGAGVDALPVVVHRLNDGALALRRGFPLPAAPLLQHMVKTTILKKVGKRTSCDTVSLKLQFRRPRDQIFVLYSRVVTGDTICD